MQHVGIVLREMRRVACVDLRRCRVVIEVDGVEHVRFLARGQAQRGMPCEVLRQCGGAGLLHAADHERQPRRTHGNRAMRMSAGSGNRPLKRSMEFSTTSNDRSDS